MHCATAAQSMTQNQRNLEVAGRWSARDTIHAGLQGSLISCNPLPLVKSLGRSFPLDLSSFFRFSGFPVHLRNAIPNVIPTTLASLCPRKDPLTLVAVVGSFKWQVKQVISGEQKLKKSYGVSWVWRGIKFSSFIKWITQGSWIQRLKFWACSCTIIRFFILISN